jgi:hypothetical protein
MNRKICYLAAVAGAPAASTEGDDMRTVLTRCLMVAGMAAAASIGLDARPGHAHNDWGLPLVGGLAGGFALSSMMHRGYGGGGGGRERVYEEPAYAAPAPTYVEPAPTYAAPAAPGAPSAATIEHQLNVLDQLAAKGYITQEEYQARRQALLNEL